MSGWGPRHGGRKRIPGTSSGQSGPIFDRKGDLYAMRQTLVLLALAAIVYVLYLFLRKPKENRKRTRRKPD